LVEREAKRMSKILSKDINTTYEACNFPEFNPDGVKNIKVITVGQLENIHKEAYEEGVVLGRSEAFDKCSDQMHSIIMAIADTRQQFDESTISEIAELIITCSKQLLHYEIQTNPDVIVSIVKEGIELLPTSSREISIHLHPDHSKIINELISRDNIRNVKIIPDALIAHGGCLIVSDDSRIDATMESRLTSVINKMLDTTANKSQ
jgi:flagellar assembly protein FliH